MGLFDARCLATGVSLKGADAALVLLQHREGRHVPISLAIKGNYDRLGSIDGIEEGANTRLVLRFFLDALRSGEFEVDEGELARCGGFPIRTVVDLLRGCERNMNDGPGYAVLDGEPVVFALIARAVWDGIARGAPRRERPAAAAFERVFGAAGVGSRLYAGSLDEVSGHVRELAAVDSFLSGRGLAWQPTPGGGQDYSEEMRQYLSEARRAYSDSATVTAALDYYEDEVRDLLGTG